MPLVMTEDQNVWFQKMRGEWFEVMRPFDGYRPSGLLQPLPALSPDLLENCKVLPDRHYILPLMPKHARVAEVGTQQGHFADHIIERCSPSELHLYDIDFSPLKVRTDTELTKTAMLHEGDSATMLAEMPDDYFDWIYIDGDHSYAGVKRDIEVARTKVKPGGFLWFNDFVLWSAVECIDYGVPHAVCELALNHRFEFTHLALHFLMYCDVALRRPLV